MTHAASPDPLLLLVAYADGELAAAATADVEAQLAASAELRNQLEDIRVLQAGLRANLPAAPDELDAAHRQALLALVQPLRIRRWPVIRWLAAACLVFGMLGLWMAPSLIKSEIRNNRFGIIEQLGQSDAAASAAPYSTGGPTMGGMGFATAVTTAPPPPAFMAIGVGGGARATVERDDEPAAVGQEMAQAEEAEKEPADQPVSSIDDVQILESPELRTFNGQWGPVVKVKPSALAAKEEVAARLDTVSMLEKKNDSMQKAAAQQMPAPSAPPAVQAPLGMVGTFSNGAIHPDVAAKAKDADGEKHEALRELGNLKQNAELLPAKPLVVNEVAANGPALLHEIRAKGGQLQPLADGLEAVTTNDRRPLDPTATFGLAKTDFAKAFGTVPMTATADTATLTFAFTADTASFDRARSELRSGRMVDPSGIRAEHFVNAVPAGYPAAVGPEAFTLYAEAGPSPFAAGSLAPRTALVSVGAVARPAGADERRPLALTLAIDCSGSMAQPGGLDRVRAGLAELLAQLGDDDSVAVVAFGDRARIVLPATPGTERQRIAAAVDALQPGGSTNAGEGLGLAYQLAAESAKPGRESRVLLTTDGATLAGDGAAPLLERIAADRARGISLIVVGCGGQQYQGAALDALAAKGDGQHVYVGSDDEARALFRDRLVPGKLGVLARDAKVQVTWNPQRVSHARLIGFETRRLAAKDFRNDAVDAGEIAHDTQATALFEVVLTDGGSGPLGSAAVRYLDTRLGTVRELACPLPGSLVQTHDSQRLRLMACSATLADLLGRTWWANQRCATYAGLLAELARCAPSHFRDELRQMAEQAQRVTGEP